MSESTNMLAEEINVKFIMSRIMYLESKVAELEELLESKVAELQTLQDLHITHRDEYLGLDYKQQRVFIDRMDTYHVSKTIETRPYTEVV